jgi:membrane protein implicated in regulation of membrane protease activity
MTWEMFYLICFGVGLALTVVSLAGGFHHQLHFGMHHGVHVGHVGHGHGPGNRGGVSPVNGFTLTAFLCWFGGAGYLLERYGGLVTPAILGFAMLSGLAGGTLIFWFLAKVLSPHDRALTAEETEMTGVIGRVSGTIRGEGTGEILYSQNGARRSSPARSDNGLPIARDSEVVVMRYERGVAYVRRWEEVSDGQALSSDMKRAQT